jgi:hypothetical protein
VGASIGDLVLDDVMNIRNGLPELAHEGFHSLREA